MIYQTDDENWQADLAVDASLCGLWQFGMYAVDDPKIKASMDAIRNKLWVKTEIGGIARYENDGPRSQQHPRQPLVCHHNVDSRVVGKNRAIRS